MSNGLQLLYIASATVALLLCFVWAALCRRRRDEQTPYRAKERAFRESIEAAWGLVDNLSHPQTPQSDVFARDLLNRFKSLDPQQRFEFLEELNYSLAKRGREIEYNGRAHIIAWVLHKILETVDFGDVQLNEYVRVTISSVGEETQGNLDEYWRFRQVLATLVSVLRPIFVAPAE